MRVLSRFRPEGQTETWRSRAVLPVVVAVCVAVTGIAVTGGVNPSPGLEFAQAGHWIYNSVLGSALHVDGGSKQIDAEVAVPGADPGATVVQTRRNGYVLSRGQIIEFGKSDLAVADPVESPADEQPVGLEAAGAAYAIYPTAGKIVRFGEQSVVESAGGRLGRPVATSDGTLWVHRADGGQLCRLPLDASRLTCTGTTPAGHTGELTLVGDQPVWVDSTANTMSTVADDGLGRRVPLGVELPSGAKVAANDLDGRIAVLDPDESVLHLIDAASTIDGEVVEPPISTALRSGRYEQIASSGSTLALIDADTDTVLSLDADGEVRTSVPIPARSTAASGDTEPTLFRGEDSRLYVDSASGEHVMVVEDEGDITPVRADGVPSDDPGGRTPTPSPSHTPEPEKTKEPKPDKTDEPPVPASRPSAPYDVDGVAGDASATVTWGAARGNGARVTAYVLSWSGGSKQVSSDAREATISGLRNGSSYAVTVSAVNRMGTGPGATTEQLYPGGRAAAPPNFDVREMSSGRYHFTWEQPALEGGGLIEYRLSNGQSTERTTGTSQTWSGLDDGRTYRFEVKAITRTSSGEVLAGKSADLTLTVPAGPQIVASKGPSTDYNDDCQADSGCAFVEFEGTGLKPNTEYTFAVYASDWGKFNDVTLTTDANGLEHEDEQFACDPDGQQVWIVAEGPGGPIRSNKFTWPG